MTAKQFKEAVYRRALNRSIEGARLVLVHGYSRNQAAKQIGINVMAVSRMVKTLT